MLKVCPFKILDDPKFLLEEVPLSGSGGECVMKWASVRLRDSDRFVVAVCRAVVKAHDLKRTPVHFERRNFVRACEHMSDRLKSDEDFIMKFVGEFGLEILEHVSADLMSDRRFFLKISWFQVDCVNEEWKIDLLQYASEELKADREIVMGAVKLHGEALRHASAELRGDREIVTEALMHDEEGLSFLFCNLLRIVSAELQRDREVVTVAVKQNGLALCYASTELKGDREISTLAVRQNGRALQYASVELKGDRAIVTEAVTQDGSALQYASAELRSDFSIGLVAIQSNGKALQYASEAVRSDRRCVLMAFKNGADEIGWGSFLGQYVSEDLRADKDVALAAVERSGENISVVPAALRSDRKILIAALRKQKQVLGDVLRDDAVDSERIRGDPEIMMAALAFRKRYMDQYLLDRRGDEGLASPVLKDGGLKAYVVQKVRNVFNVPDYTFASTFLFRFREELPTGVLKLVAELAGVRCGKDWKIVRRAAFHLGVSVFMKRHATGKMSQRAHANRKQHKKIKSTSRDVWSAVGLW